MYDAEVVYADVGELWAACNFTNGPNARRGRLQSFVDLDKSAVGQFHAGQLQAEPLSVRSASCSH